MATKILSKIKAEMTFNADLTRLVDVMKGIAAAQYQIMERKRLHHAEEYGKAVEELFGAFDFRTVNHPFVKAKNNKKLICLITTDSGFLGGLNMKVAQAGLKQEEPGTHYLVLGERGVNFMKEYGRAVTAYPGINTDESRFALMHQLIGDILKAVLKDGYGKVVMVYPKSLSFTTQRVEALNLIPCPMFYVNRPPKAKPLTELQKETILESPVGGIIENLVRLWLGRKLIEVFETSKLSEFGARTMHLEESFQTLSKQNKQIKLEFFKARRAKIDQSLRESFTSQLSCE